MKLIQLPAHGAPTQPQNPSRKIPSLLSILLPSFFCLVCGVLLILLQSLALRITAWVLAATLLGFGIWFIIRYFRSEQLTRVLESSLACGLILITAAVLLAFSPDYLRDFLPFIWGLSMLFGAFLKIQYAFDEKNARIKNWWLMLVFAVFSMIFGILSLLRPEFFGDKFEIVVGVFLIVEGILDVVVYFLLSKAIKKMDGSAAAPAAPPAASSSPVPVTPSPAAPVAPAVPADKVSDTPAPEPSPAQEQ